MRDMEFPRSDDSEAHIVPVAPRLSDEERALVREIDAEVREDGKAIDREFADVLGGAGVDPDADQRPAGSSA